MDSFRKVPEYKKTGEDVSHYHKLQVRVGGHRIGLKTLIVFRVVPWGIYYKKKPTYIMIKLIPYVGVSNYIRIVVVHFYHTTARDTAN